RRAGIAQPGSLRYLGNRKAASRGDRGLWGVRLAAGERGHHAIPGGGGLLEVEFTIAAQQLVGGGLVLVPAAGGVVHSSLSKSSEPGIGSSIGSGVMGMGSFTNSAIRASPMYRFHSLLFG